MSRLVRTLNFIAGVTLATFALEVARRLPDFTAHLPGAVVLIACAWSAAAAWAAVVLIGRAG